MIPLLFTILDLRRNHHLCFWCLLLFPKDSWWAVERSTPLALLWSTPESADEKNRGELDIRRHGKMTQWSKHCQSALFVRIWWAAKYLRFERMRLSTERKGVQWRSEVHLQQLLQCTKYDLPVAVFNMCQWSDNAGEASIFRRKFEWIEQCIVRNWYLLCRLTKPSHTHCKTRLSAITLDKQFE